MRVSFGMMGSFLCLDSNDSGTSMASVDFTVQPFAPDGKEFPVVGIEQTELHHLYYDWIERYADHQAR